MIRLGIFDMSPLVHDLFLNKAIDFLHGIFSRTVEFVGLGGCGVIMNHSLKSHSHINSNGQAKSALGDSWKLSRVMQKPKCSKGDPRIQTWARVERW